MSDNINILWRRWSSDGNNTFLFISPPLGGSTNSFDSAPCHIAAYKLTIAKMAWRRTWVGGSVCSLRREDEANVLPVSGLLSVRQPASDYKRDEWEHNYLILRHRLIVSLCSTTRRRRGAQLGGAQLGGRVTMTKRWWIMTDSYRFRCRHIMMTERMARQEYRLCWFISRCNPLLPAHRAVH